MKRIIFIFILCSFTSVSFSQYNPYPTYSTSIGFGLTGTDVAATIRLGYQFKHWEGWLGEKLSSNGFYATYAKGRYPFKGLAGVKDHWKTSFGIMIGSPWAEFNDWSPTINIGVSRHWYTAYNRYDVDPQHPAFYKWDFEFGSAGQIGHYYPWIIVGIRRQLEMTFGVGIVFN